MIIGIKSYSLKSNLDLKEVRIRMNRLHLGKEVNFFEGNILYSNGAKYDGYLRGLKFKTARNIFFLRGRNPVIVEGEIVKKKGLIFIQFKMGFPIYLGLLAVLLFIAFNFIVWGAFNDYLPLGAFFIITAFLTFFSGFHFIFYKSQRTKYLRDFKQVFEAEEI